MVAWLNDKWQGIERMKKTLLIIAAIVSLLLIARTQSHDYKYMKDLKDSTYIEYKPHDTMRNPMTGKIVTTIE